jgi:hypothetical protein
LKASFINIFARPSSTFRQGSKLLTKCYSESQGFSWIRRRGVVGEDVIGGTGCRPDLGEWRGVSPPVKTGQKSLTAKTPRAPREEERREEEERRREAEERCGGRILSACLAFFSSVFLSSSLGALGVLAVQPFFLSVSSTGGLTLRRSPD